MTHQDINHLPIERIWAFIYQQLELGLEEQRHLNLCLKCANSFRLCVTSDTLDHAVRELDGDAAEAA